MLLFTFSRLQRTIPKPKKIKYIENPCGLGDLIKNRRLFLGLTQEQAGAKIGVKREGLCDWENQITEPTIEFYPAIVLFLGYDPFSFDESTLIGRIKKYRYGKGLSQDALGKQLGIGGATIARVELNIGMPSNATKRALVKIGIAI